MTYFGDSKSKPGKMKLVFMGSPEFAVNCLEKIHHSTHEILAVVTVPDKAQGRGKKVQPSPVKMAAEKLGYPILQPENLKSPDFKAEIERLNPELIVVVAFRILPESIFTIPVFGTVNIHASLLPKYRGAAPINHALLNGDTVTGVTSFYITEQVDAGTILLQKEITILPDDNFETLYNKLAKLGAELIVETLDQLDGDGIAFKVQRPEEVSSAPKINRDMCMIDWSKPGESIVNQVRAFSPKPAAFTYLNSNQFKIIKARFQPGDEFANSKNGEIVISTKKEIAIKCSNGLIYPEIIQMQGKKEMPVNAFLNGYPLETGTILNGDQ
ncbi:MAG: methionyl-tRNA formyltransferase [Calditrichaeota bacterium]|nr:methionyl-tRNA formyltransferase [Calditrichota bacterium]